MKKLSIMVLLLVMVLPLTSHGFAGLIPHGSTGGSGSGDNAGGSYAPTYSSRDSYADTPSGFDGRGQLNSGVAPEPASLILFAVGLAGAGVVRRLRKGNNGE